MTDQSDNLMKMLGQMDFWFGYYFGIDPGDQSILRL